MEETKEILAERERIMAERNKTIEDFYNQYPYSEPKDISGFGEGDLLKYQHALGKHDKSLVSLASHLKPQTNPLQDNSALQRGH